jgi:hypothetical protein
MYLQPQCMHTAESQEDYLYTRKGFAVEQEMLEGSQPHPGTPRHFLRCAQKGSRQRPKVVKAEIGVSTSKDAWESCLKKILELVHLLRK